MNRQKVKRFCRIFSALSLLGASAILFQPHVSPRMIVGTVCLTLFFSIVLNMFVTMINEEVHSQPEWRPNHLTLSRYPSRPGSSISHTPSSTPLLRMTGTAENPPLPVSLKLISETNSSSSEDTLPSA